MHSVVIDSGQLQHIHNNSQDPGTAAASKHPDSAASKYPDIFLAGTRGEFILNEDRPSWCESLTKETHYDVMTIDV